MGEKFKCHVIFDFLCVKSERTLKMSGARKLHPESEKRLKPDAAGATKCSF